MLELMEGFDKLDRSNPTVSGLSFANCVESPISYGGSDCLSFLLTLLFTFLTESPKQSYFQ
jgi:hypothetical protein